MLNGFLVLDIPFSVEEAWKAAGVTTPQSSAKGAGSDVAPGVTEQRVGPGVQIGVREIPSLRTTAEAGALVSVSSWNSVVNRRRHRDREEAVVASVTGRLHRWRNWGWHSCSSRNGLRDRRIAIRGLAGQRRPPRCRSYLQD